MSPRRVRREHRGPGLGIRPVLGEHPTSPPVRRGRHWGRPRASSRTGGAAAGPPTGNRVDRRRSSRSSRPAGWRPSPGRAAPRRSGDELHRRLVGRAGQIMLVSPGLERLEAVDDQVVRRELVVQRRHRTGWHTTRTAGAVPAAPPRRRPASPAVLPHPNPRPADQRGQQGTDHLEEVLPVADQAVDQDDDPDDQ